MAIETYPDQLEPASPDAVIWRFMKMERFSDVMKTGELYFCRADRLRMSTKDYRLKITCARSLVWIGFSCPTAADLIMSLALSRSSARACTSVAGICSAAKPIGCGMNTATTEWPFAPGTPC